MPACHSHPDHPITSLCLHPSCVVPLCLVCQHKHRSEFPQGDHLSRNVRWPEVQGIAIGAIDGQRSRLLEMEKEIEGKLEEFRVRVSITVGRCLEGISKSVRERVGSVRESIVGCEKSAALIAQGNVKEIISHFDYGNVFKCPRYQLSYQVLEQTLGQCLSSFISVKTLNVAQSHRQSVVHKQQQNKIEQTKNKNQIQDKELRVEDLNVQFINSRSRPRLGIFVASSPNKTRKGYISQSLESRRLKQKYLNQQDQKPKAHFTPNSKKQHRSIFKSSIQVKQSPFFSQKKQLNIKDLTTPNKLQKDQNRHLHTKSQKTINKVINRNSLASQSTSRLIIRRNQNIPNDLLTPQQMKQLIMRKKPPITVKTQLEHQPPMYYQRLLTDKLSLAPK